MSDTPTVVLLHGNDEYAIAAHIEKLCNGLGDPSSAAMNIAKFDGRTGFEYEAITAAVNAAPFLAPRRVVVLLHPISACSSPERREKLLGLFSKAPHATTIILAEFDELKNEKKQGKSERHWLLKWVTQAGPQVTVHGYNLPKRWEMARWIEGETKKQGGRIEADAAARLAEMVGEDTRIAAQELTKLLTYVNFNRPINLVDVENVSFISAQGSVFDLVDALGQGNGKKAQHTLHQLLADQDATELWGMVIRQFRLLLQTRELLDENASNFEIQKALGLHEYVAQKVASQAKRFSMPMLEIVYHRLLDIDEEIKTSQTDLDLALDVLIAELSLLT
jgi:DNA polymerase-3 subunit delta